MNSNLIRAIAQAVAQAEVQKAVVSSDGSLQTTDGTATVLGVLTTVPNTAGVIEFTIIGVLADSTKAVTVKRIVRYLNNGTTLTIGTPADLLAIQNDGLLASASITVSGMDLQISVAGGATDTINWQINIDHKYLTIPSLT